MRALVVVAAVAALLADNRAEAASCRDYPATAARTIKPRVEALRATEREAADRIKGLDTRPYPYLVGQARAVAEAIGEARALLDEDDLDRCPEAMTHVRRVCATAARALAVALEEQAAGGASQFLRQIYTQAMVTCEGAMHLSPLRTPFRGAD
ncbi:MAG TPA: hypothetical protein VIY51_16465 [Xanthobacteraceae bacterium]